MSQIHKDLSFGLLLRFGGQPSLSLSLYFQSSPMVRGLVLQERVQSSRGRVEKVKMASRESVRYQGWVDAFLGVNLITWWYSLRSDIWQRTSKSRRGTASPFQIALSRRQSRVLRQAQFCSARTRGAITPNSLIDLQISRSCSDDRDVESIKRGISLTINKKTSAVSIRENIDSTKCRCYYSHQLMRK